MEFARLRRIALALAGAAVTVGGTLVLSYGSVNTSPADDPASAGADQQPPAGTFLKGWGQPIDPDGDCSFELENGRLTIKVPAKAHGLEAEGGTLNAPRILRDIEGDFISDIQLEGNLKPVGPSPNPKYFPFVGAGLLLWNDEGNYIRLERAAIVRNGQLVPYILFQERKNSLRVPPDGGIAAPSGTCLLRLERKGDQISASVSANGTEWRAFPRRTVVFPAKLKLGVAAITSSTQPFTVTLSNFRVLRPERVTVTAEAATP